MFLTSLGRGSKCGSFTDLLLITMSPVTIRRWNTSLMLPIRDVFLACFSRSDLLSLFFWLLAPLHSSFQLEALRKTRSLLHVSTECGHLQPFWTKGTARSAVLQFPDKMHQISQWKFARYGNEDYMESVDKRFVQATYICKGLFILKCSPCSVTVICISGTLIWLVYL